MVTAPSPALSPDGRKLAFVATSEGEASIWIRSLDSSTAQVLPGTEGAAKLFWSPDGQFIVFSQANNAKKIAASGGPPLLLCTECTPGARGGDWSPDGVILLGQGPGPIVRVPVDGGQPTPITELDSSRRERSHNYPSFLPDGRRFLYLAQNQEQQDSVLWVGSIDSKERRLVPGITSQAVYSTTGHLLFIREGTLMAQSFDVDRLLLSGEAIPIADQVAYNSTTGGAGAFTVSRNGSLAYRTGRAGAQLSNNHLTWYDREGNQLAVVGPRGEYTSPELSPDDRYVAFQRRSPSSVDIWVMDIQRALPSRVTSHLAGDLTPTWSADGRKIAFASRRESNLLALYERPFGVVGEDNLLLTMEADSSQPYWSRGGYLAFISENDVWAVSTSDRKPLRVTETPFVESDPRISPDGRWIAYGSNESGRTEIFVQSFPGHGIKQPVSTGGGQTPHWSWDGKELFYVTPVPDSWLMAVSIAARGSSLEMGLPRPLFQPALGNTTRGYDVAADGRFLLSVPLPDLTPSPITVVLNWAAGREK
jgi:Tol biopolymer transport system component